MDAVLIARDFESNLIPIAERHGVKNADLLLIRLIQYVGRTSPLCGEIVCSRKSFHRLALSNALGSVRKSTGQSFWDALVIEKVIVDTLPPHPAWLRKLLDPDTISPNNKPASRTGTHTDTDQVRVPTAHAGALSESESESERGSKTPTPSQGSGFASLSFDPEEVAAGLVVSWATRRADRKGAHHDRAKSTLIALREKRLNYQRELAWIEVNDPDMLRRIQSAMRRAAKANPTRNGDPA